MVNSFTSPIPDTNCYNDNYWSDHCITRLKNDLYDYFSYKYTKEDVDCALKKISIEKLYKSPYEFYKKFESLLRGKMIEELDKCKIKRSDKNIKIVSNLFSILLFVFLIIGIIYFVKNKNLKSKK